MPTYQTRGGRTRAIIRLKGHEAVSDTFATKAKARAWATKTEADMLEGRHVVVSRMTVLELFKKFHDEVAKDRWTCIRLNKLAREPFGIMPASHCADGLAEWAEVRKKIVKPNTVLREAAVISGVFKHAMKKWKLKVLRNPASAMDLPKVGRPRNRRVSDAELAALWGYFGLQLTGRKRDYVPWMFEFGCETGMRLGEMCRLRWKDVHEDERWLYVLPSKNEDDRNGVLTVRAVEMLGALPRVDDRVFPVNVGSLGAEFRVGLKALGIENLHFHDSRHEATSRLAKYLSVLELARVIGHRDTKSLMAYYNPTAAELAAKIPGGTRSTPPHP